MKMITRISLVRVLLVVIFGSAPINGFANRPPPSGGPVRPNAGGRSRTEQAAQMAANLAKRRYVKSGSGPTRIDALHEGVVFPSREGQTEIEITRDRGRGTQTSWSFFSRRGKPAPTLESQEVHSKLGDRELVTEIFRRELYPQDGRSLAEIQTLAATVSPGQRTATAKEARAAAEAVLRTNQSHHDERRGLSAVPINANHIRVVSVHLDEGPGVNEPGHTSRVFSVGPDQQLQLVKVRTVRPVTLRRSTVAGIPQRHFLESTTTVLHPSDEGDARVLDAFQIIREGVRSIRVELGVAEFWDALLDETRREAAAWDQQQQREQAPNN